MEHWLENLLNQTEQKNLFRHRFGATLAIKAIRYT